MALDSTTIGFFAEAAVQGMTDYQDVGLGEDAAKAARTIVDNWEEEEGLLYGKDLQDWKAWGPTKADEDELRDRCTALIKSAILAMRET